MFTNQTMKGYVGTWIDLAWLYRTELEKVRDELQAKNERLHAVIDALHDGDSNPCPMCHARIRNLIEAMPGSGHGTPSEPETLAQKHMQHYRSCNCLGDSAECCRADCECHSTPSEGEK